MKKIRILLWVFFSLASYVYAQEEENIWVLTEYGGFDFTNNFPVQRASNHMYQSGNSASICDKQGRLLFYSDGHWAWNRNHELMPEHTDGIVGITQPAQWRFGHLALMPWTGGHATQTVAIIARPAMPDRYYIFSLGATGNLYYSEIDMSLNGGLGGVIKDKRRIIIAGALTEKLTVVEGCNSIWVMVRDRDRSQYRAFEVRQSGVNHTPVLSHIGSFSEERLGVIKFSPDGKKMASTNYYLDFRRRDGVISVFYGGVELYDFDKNTGKLSNALVLDKDSLRGHFYGACFSPDNTKLYISLSSGFYDYSYKGKVLQFDLSLPSDTEIVASKKVVFTDFSVPAALDARYNVGDLKRSKDGKIYFSSVNNGVWGSFGVMIAPPTPYYHCILRPNLADTFCRVIENYVEHKLQHGRGMPNDIALMPAPDSVSMHKNAYACFTDTLYLQADTGKWYMWDNGLEEQTRIITQNGKYVVQYINLNCEYQTDTIQVHFYKLPNTGAADYACQKSQSGYLWATPAISDTAVFTYTWKDTSGNTLRQISSNRGDTIAGLDPGSYFLQISTATGCDTTLPMNIKALPAPDLTLDTDSIGCIGMPFNLNYTGAESIWKWHLPNGQLANERTLNYYFKEKGKHSIWLVAQNIEGCSDTVLKDIDVKELELELTADRQVISIHEQVNLHAQSNEQFTVLAWSPTALFANQTAYSQSAVLDTTTLFTVKGKSVKYGCEATASLTVMVRPKLFMPTAFTPNGDGENDYFRPYATGPFFVRSFAIFNRWGQQVYVAHGDQSIKGWDGTFNNQDCPTATYFYHIIFDTDTNETVQLKGDVVLIR